MRIRKIRDAKEVMQVVFGIALSVLMISCESSSELQVNNGLDGTTLTSPSNINTIDFFLDKNGVPCYLVRHGEKLVVDTSKMSFEFKGQEPIKGGMKIINSTQSDFNETWEMPWGERRLIKNEYRQLLVELEETTEPKRQINIYFKAYDDGVGFRYEFKKQEDVDSVIITNEHTEFNMTADHMCWWTPGDWDSYEHPYFTNRLSEIDALTLQNNVLAQSRIVDNAVNTPLTMRSDDGLHISIHEANLTNYAGMTVKIDTKDFVLKSGLVGSDITDYKVKRELPFKTPWRTIQIADKATELLESNLIVNLNEPNKLGDVSWFEPKKYIGIWWEMHIGKASWDYESGKHGATTKNTKKYIDFASKNGFKGVLVEGWNTGWDHWIGFDDREGVFDFVTTYPDYDLKGLVEYGKQRGVELIMHHETSAAPRTYDQQLDTAYALMKSLGIHSVKTGYVGPIIPKGEYHHGQWMVNHYRRVLEKGAANQVAINAHEPIKPTGLRRTYPNAISREGARGQEFNAWASDGGNSTEHLSILAFTRMLAGPMDFTPGVFDITLPTKPKNQINTTLAHQLALYVVLYSPIQMACDLPENYEGQPGLQFIKDVGVDWEESKALNGEVGDFVTIARKERKTENWFVGGISDENKREVTLKFDFLEDGRTYKAIYYVDGAKAHFKSNPTSLSVVEENVTSVSEKTIIMAEGGGFAISLLASE